MQSFLSQIKILPTLIAIGAIIVTALFWKQGPRHEYMIGLSLAMIGAIGGLLTWSMFSTKKWSGKVFLCWVLLFMTSLTWSVSGGDWKHPMGPLMIISGICLICVILAPAWRFGRIEYREYPTVP